MKSTRRVQPLSLSERPKRARSTTTITEAITQVWDPRWALLIAAMVGVFVFLLRMPITGHMVGIAIEARRIAARAHWTAGERDDAIIAFLLFCLEIYQAEQQRKRALH